MKQTNKAKTIGACEWCGVVDHHLVAAACPPCQARARTLSPADPRLGAEADVSYALAERARLTKVGGV